MDGVSLLHLTLYLSFYITCYKTICTCFLSIWYVAFVADGIQVLTTLTLPLTLLLTLPLTPFKHLSASEKSRSKNKTSRDTYELIYSPLHSGEFQGRISFSNPKMGQFWYILNLIATPAVSTVLDRIECMVGSTTTISVPVENPLGKYVRSS